MSLLLTDEEILASMGTNSVDCLDCGMSLEAFHKSNKAQLKKLVEWLRDNGVEDVLDDGTDSWYFGIPQECWQALLEEVSDALE